MSEYHHLIGAEDVQRAGSAMRDAAESISRAMSGLDDYIFRFSRVADRLCDSMDRLSAQLQESQLKPETLTEDHSDGS